MRPPLNVTPPSIQPAPESGGQTEEAGGPSVLVVEDDQTSASALRIILTRRGYDVRVASSVAEANELLAAAPSTVLLDLMLPDGDGLLILDRLRRMKSPSKIVVTTSVSDPDHLMAARRFRPHAILQKPINLAELFRVMSR